MSGQLRELRQRIRAVSTIQKTTRAMELVAASRIRKARERVAEATPYSRELARAVSALVTYAHVDHPLTTEPDNPTRAAMLLVSSDRGLAGAYSANVVRQGEQLAELLRGEGKEVEAYLTGRKAVAYYNFRDREIAGEWTGFSDRPTYADAKPIGELLVNRFLARREDPTADGVDEIHVVYTHFHSLASQRPEVIRLLPLEVVEGEEPPTEQELLPEYEFEPSASEVLDVLLPRYVQNRIHHCLLQAAASELASRQRAMKAASDNADDLVKTLTQQRNAARQAEITQEISEIVGGASALAEATSGD